MNHLRAVEKLQVKTISSVPFTMMPRVIMRNDTANQRAGNLAARTKPTFITITGKKVITLR